MISIQQLTNKLSRSVAKTSDESSLNVSLIEKLEQLKWEEDYSLVNLKNDLITWYGPSGERVKGLINYDSSLSDMVSNIVNHFDKPVGQTPVSKTVTEGGVTYEVLPPDKEVHTDDHSEMYKYSSSKQA